MNVIDRVAAIAVRVPQAPRALRGNGENLALKGRKVRRERGVSRENPDRRGRQVREER